MKNLIRFDWAIKRLLRNKANFGILEGFLSELLEEDIKIESILESESNKETAGSKLNGVDLLVRNAKGELIIIEVQNDYQADYLLRMLFGTARLIVDNIDEGMAYREVKKVISIHIVYFDLGVGGDYIYYGSTSFWGKHKKDMLQLSKQEQEIFQADVVSKIYPQYYIIKVNDFDNIAKDTLDEWINFLKTQEIKEGTMAKGLKEAKEKLNYLHLTEEEKREYQRYIENWRDNEGIIVGNYNKGRYEGKMEEKIEIVKNCLENGLGIEMISKLTGLSKEEIKKLKLDWNFNARS
jgi:predicted transposase/invertase (TIGR01784 family)